TTTSLSGGSGISGRFPQRSHAIAWISEDAALRTAVFVGRCEPGGLSGGGFSGGGLSGGGFCACGLCGGDSIVGRTASRLNLGRPSKGSAFASDLARPAPALRRTLV